MDRGVLIAQMMYEIRHGRHSASYMRDLRNQGGFVPTSLYIDAKSVFAALRATFIKTPADCSLLTHLHYLNEQLQQGII